MQYLGGKSKTAPHIAPILNDLVRGKTWVEPFMGSCWVTIKITEAKERIFGDANDAVVALFQRLMEGWEPPTEVTEAEYQAIKASPQDYPPELVAFVAVGCSWGGKWWGGYARGQNGNYAGCAYGGLLRKKKHLEGVIWRPGSYTQFSDTRGAVIYCDPPYDETTGYGVGDFDSAAFWDWCEEMARWNTVVVSEYSNPREHDVLCEKEMVDWVRRKDRSKPVEKLILVRPRRPKVRRARRQWGRLLSRDKWSRKCEF